MKHSLLLAGCAAMMLASCTNNTYRVSGEAPEGVEYVYYTSNFFEEEPQIDSVAVVDGKYVIEGDGSTPAIIAGTLDNNTQFWFVSEPGNIVIDSLSLPSGTPQNDAIAQFFREAQAAETLDTFRTTLETFMQDHSNDLAGAFAMFMAAQPIGLDHTAKLLEGCGDVVKNVVYQAIPQEKFEAAAVAAKAEEATGEGKMFTDFEAEYEGKVQKLSDYVGKGKYVLVDFWASWCGPCRGEIPTIIELYNKYAGEKFEVLGVATWDEPEDTKKAIEELGIKYPQIMNAQKAGSDAYGIQGIPQIILFGPDGTILKRDLRGDDMVKAVEEVLK